MDELRELGGVTFGTNRCWRKSPRTGATFQDTDYHCFVAGHHFDDLMGGRVRTDTAFLPSRFSRMLQTRWPHRRRRFRGNMVSVNIVESHWNTAQYGKPFQTHFDRGTCVATFAGQLAMALSCYMGFTEIMLIGFDARDGEGHFFDEEPSAGNPPGFKRESMRGWFPAIKEWTDVHSIEVVNCDPESALPQFPRMTKDEVKQWLTGRAICRGA